MEALMTTIDEYITKRFKELAKELAATPLSTEVKGKYETFTAERLSEMYSDIKDMQYEITELKETFEEAHENFANFDLKDHCDVEKLVRKEFDDFKEFDMSNISREVADRLIIVTE